VSRLASLSTGLPGLFHVADRHAVLVNGVTLVLGSTAATLTALLILRWIGLDGLSMNEFGLPPLLL
jgi:hypothetical protein